MRDMNILVTGGLGFIGSNFIRHMSEETGAFEIVVIDALKYGSNEGNLKNPEVKLVQVSTDEVYGDIEGGSFKEGDMLKPSSPYSASKASADMFVLAYVRTYGLNAVITRCTNNYGDYQSPEKLIPKTIIRAKRDMKVPIYGTGKNVRDWIYVRDHCDAIRLVLDGGEKGEIYNLENEWWWKPLADEKILHPTPWKLEW
jgi:dTDP-D-glucose 4,6-dehydratase